MQNQPTRSFWAIVQVWLSLTTWLSVLKKRPFAPFTRNEEGKQDAQRLSHFSRLFHTFTFVMMPISKIALNSLFAHCCVSYTRIAEWLPKSRARLWRKLKHACLCHRKRKKASIGLGEEVVESPERVDLNTICHNASVSVVSVSVAFQGVSCVSAPLLNTYN